MLQTLLEGRLLNLDMTSPAATVALALMFLQTNDAAVAASLAPPATKFALDFARPDFVMLRVLARNLVMWDDLQPSAAWMAAQLPDIIRVSPGACGAHAGPCVRLLQTQLPACSMHGAAGPIWAAGSPARAPSRGLVRSQGPRRIQPALEDPSNPSQSPAGRCARRTPTVSGRTGAPTSTPLQGLVRNWGAKEVSKSPHKPLKNL